MCFLLVGGAYMFMSNVRKAVLDLGGVVTLRSVSGPISLHPKVSRFNAKPSGGKLQFPQVPQKLVPNRTLEDHGNCDFGMPSQKKSGKV